MPWTPHRDVAEPNLTAEIGAAMKDPRITRLAETLIHYSCDLQPGEKVLIEAIEIPTAMTCELVRVAGEAGAQPFVTLKNQAVWRALQLAGSEEQMTLIGEVEAKRMREMDAYIGIRGSSNVSEWSDVPTEQMSLYETHMWTPVHLGIRVPDTKWVVLRWPSASMAQLAQVSTEAFEDFYFDVCTLDYARMSKAMVPLQTLMNATDRVKLVSPGTELEFSIRDIPAVLCDGHRNIPDGEVFTAPVRDSVNGVIQYNTPTLYHGVTHENIRLEFRDGKIVDAKSNDTEHLRYRRGCSLRRRVRHRVPPAHSAADERHPVRRENRREHSLHPGPVVRECVEWQRESDPLGSRADDGSRGRGRRGLVRRSVGSKGWPLRLDELQELNPDRLTA